MEKNRSFEILNELYKPYKITKKNNVYILKTTEGDYAVKLNPKIDYKKLYGYLYSRNFNYLPALSVDSRDDMIVLEYQEDMSIDDNQKAMDLIKLVALLHSKTSFFKKITPDKYKEIYDNILENIAYIEQKNENYFREFMQEEYIIPSHYLFLRNYSLIYNAIHYSYDRLEKWYQLVKDKLSQRVVLVHNNLGIDHLIKNEKDYLISWDSYTFDTPVLDLYHLYQKDWEKIGFVEVLTEYTKQFDLLEEERLLLDILISIPKDLKFDSTEYNNCYKVRELINYLSRSSLVVLEKD